MLAPLVLLVLVLHTTWWGVLFVFLYPLSFINRKLFESVESTCFKWLASIFVFVAEHVSGMKYVYSGDPFPDSSKPCGNVLCLPNHISSVDFFINLLVAFRSGASGFARFAMKKSLKYVPPAGPVMVLHEMLFLSREWNRDKGYLTQQLDRWNHHGTPVFLVLYPEGTYVTPDRMELVASSHKFSDERHVPRFDHVLFPRVKGTQLILSRLHSHLDELYDVTLAYDCDGCHPALGRSVPPTFMGLVAGHHTGSRVHVHVRRLKISDLPLPFGKNQPTASDDHADEMYEKWLVEVFAHKEKLLKHFAEHRSFPGQSRELITSPSESIGLLFASLTPPLIMMLLAIYLVFSCLSFFWAVMVFGFSTVFTVVLTLGVFFTLKAQGLKKTVKTA
eukprot:TRINITY_DN4125_c0_g2_i3.p1 TRINITY_DN4125_c0_g2~~TRINITY_DN4125_c0_g2_i3.p1  ORF type:complete len:390 (+),score=111.74 TRINITY_DN4125_c0_g2_i3:82-1251(+)